MLKRNRSPSTSSPSPPSPTSSALSHKISISNKDVIATKGGRRDFIKKRVIGKGAFGTVYLVQRKHTRQLLAMKVMRKNAIMSDPDSLRHVIMELEFMKQLSHHPFIVSLHSSFQTDKEVSLVMEWIGGGSLFDFLVEHRKPFTPEIAQFYSAQVLLALQTLHSNDIVYRDLKLENILLDEKGYIRLSDFGLSARARKGERIHSFSGTATYLAPEIIIDNGEDGHDNCVDFWCFGVMLFIMLTMQPPFWSEHYPDLFYLIRTKDVDFSPFPFLSPIAIDLLTLLLAKDPKKRLGCMGEGVEEVKRHAFFENFDWKLLLAKKITPPFRPSLYKGKRITEEEEEEEEEEEGAEQHTVDLFKGFSFVWNPDESDDLLSEEIQIFQQNKREKLRRKNRIVANFFLWIKEINGTAQHDFLSYSVRWKHEEKKYVTTIGPDEAESAAPHTDFVEPLSPNANSIIFEGDLHRACSPFDYLLKQDRKTMKFDSRPISFSLIALTKEKKSVNLGSFTLDMADYCFHKLEKTQIFSFENTGYTAILSIICSWRSFNGDLVDNYEKQRMNLDSNNSNSNINI